MRPMRWIAVAIMLDLALAAGLIALAGSPDHPDRIAAAPTADAAAIFWTEGSELELRKAAALALIERGAVGSLVCVGGARPARHFYGCRVLADELASSGIDRSRIIADAASNDSRSNLESLKSLATSNGLNTVVLISDPMHLLRISSEMKEMSFPFQTQFYSSGYGGYWNAFRRAHWEFAAWSVRLMPRNWVISLIGWTRW